MSTEQRVPGGEGPAVIDRVVPVLEARGAALIAEAIDAAREILGMEMSFVSQMTPDEQIYRFVAGDAESFGLPEGHVAAQEHGYCSRMVEGLIPNVVADVRRDERTREVLATVAADVGAYVGVPLRLADGRVYGSLCCLSHDEQPRLGERDRPVTRLLARLVADELDREIRAREAVRLEVEANATQALVAALQAREGYTAAHSRSVLELSLAVGRQLGVTPGHLTEVGQVALLHDIGKVGVPDAVLGKKGCLEGPERDVMRRHPVIGEQIVGSVDGLAHLCAAVRAEHERWDGRGYPDGLAGEDIPLASRICLACDAYDAMTTDRPYRSRLSYREAVGELTREAGRQFDPAVVGALLDVLRLHPLSGHAASDAGRALSG